MPKILLVVSIVILTRVPAIAQTNVDYIDPLVGNVGHLLQPTRPTVQLPNQMMRVYPIRNDYMDDQIGSFPLIIVSHRLGQAFSIKPFSGALSPEAWKARMTYDHDLEINRPWYYSTFLIEEGIKVEYTAGKKAGIYRMTFPAGKGQRSLLMDVYNNGGSEWKFVSDREVMAFETYHDDIKVFMYGAFSVPVHAAVEGRRAAVHFPEDAGQVEFRYAISYISPEQARKNFSEELGSIGFEALQEQGRKAWEVQMGRISTEGGTEAQKRSFYTALYRCSERMVDITEDGQYYSGYDKKVHQTDRPFYVDDWTWDTYLALHPLRTILQPALEQDMLNAYVKMYQQSGWMPTFPVLFGDHACMNGFHSSIAFLDAYRKGLRGFDAATAYEGMKKNALEATMLPWRNGPRCALDDFYQAKGYYPALRPDEKETVDLVHPFERRQAVAVTLASGYDDWALGEMAKELGKDADYRTFHAHASDYKNLWNAKANMFLPRDSKGDWIDIDPKYDGGKGGRDFYDENNGWTYLWQVQQDIKGLIGLMGGNAAFESRLDQLFREPLGRSRADFWYKFPDATGLVGQYSMGNEPSFHIPYLYNFTAPWKTQKRVRFLLDVWFKDNIFGIPGDEDGGGMSAFVVFSSLGFYPLTPGLPVYTIGSPVFEKSSIRLENGKQFTVLARGASKVNKYIQSAFLNGRPLNTPWFSHQQLMEGGVLELKMGAYPNKDWGVEKEATAQSKYSPSSAYMSYKGLVMAGYQGWFNAPDDGAGRGWNHYNNHGKFEPGTCKIDLWPDVSEYKKTYKTSFTDKDGKPCYVYSSYDQSSTDLHFKWMKEYGVDGAFVQRFVSNVKNPVSLHHNNVVLEHALKAAEKYHRAIAVMYDFSGMREGDDTTVIKDWKSLVDDLKVACGGKKQTYLYHRGKPLVVLWGVGFNDHRPYGLKEVEKIMDFLQHDPVYGGCAIMLGVPTYWRDLSRDTEKDPHLLDVIRKADIVHPWFVGRYNEETYVNFRDRLPADIAWCKENNLDYVPTVYPGFSWHNMYDKSPMNQIPRNRGKFYWQQIAGAIGAGAEMLYVAMFDEVDEGTAILKASKNPPVGASSFVTFEEDIPSDYYLTLTGYAGKMLRKEIPFSETIPGTTGGTGAGNGTLTSLVDPYIGSGGHGHAFVGASVPFGAIQPGPMNIFKGWDWDSGYNYGDSILTGFSHTHLNGTGIGDLGDILIMPYTGVVRTDKGTEKDHRSGYASLYTHQREQVRPGYYSVVLDDHQVQVELTATERVALHRYKFLGGGKGHIIVDLKEGVQDQSYDTYIEQTDDTTFKGYRFSKGWAKEQRIWFAIRTSLPVRDFQVYDGDRLMAMKVGQGKAMKGLMNFEQAPATLELKVSISPVSADNALANIGAEMPGWNFEEVARAADNLWEKELSKVVVETKDSIDKKIFYTALYHTMIDPALFNDHNGEYRGADGKVYAGQGFSNYSIFSLWDTYRAVHPLYTLLQPARVNDMIRSMLAIYDQQGRLPIWHLMGYETGTMVGISSQQVIAEAWLKGIRGYDGEKAFQAIRGTAMSDSLGLMYVKDLRWIPSDKQSRSVAKALEYSISDASTALMAKQMGKEDDYAYFSRRAQNYKHYYDQSAGFFRGRESGGGWRQPFDPLRSTRPWAVDYAEGNAWQYLWLVPEDVRGLMDLMGGERVFVDRLDSFFRIQTPADGEKLNDLTGLIGQYAHGNEPSHHIAYLYASAGRQWQTAEKVHYILKEFYRPQPDGTIGNEDCGQMSAWYVFSSMGFYPVFPASGKYVIGSPLFDKVALSIPGGKRFEVRTIRSSPGDIYVTGATLNGVRYTKSYILHEDILKGGTLVLTMGSQPNKNFGSDPADRP